MLRQYIKEAKMFNSKEDNPLIYTLIISRLVNTSKEDLKEDKEFMELINLVEKMISKMDCKVLKTAFSPITMFNTFTLETTKKAMKDYVKQYFNEFETLIAQEENSFENAYKIHKNFEDLYASDLWQKYINKI